MTRTVDVISHGKIVLETDDWKVEKQDILVSDNRFNYRCEKGYKYAHFSFKFHNKNYGLAFLSWGPAVCHYSIDGSVITCETTLADSKTGNYNTYEVIYRLSPESAPTNIVEREVNPIFRDVVWVHHWDDFRLNDKLKNSNSYLCFLDGCRGEVLETGIRDLKNSILGFIQDRAAAGVSCNHPDIHWGELGYYYNEHNCGGWMDGHSCREGEYPCYLEHGYTRICLVGQHKTWITVTYPSKEALKDRLKEIQDEPGPTPPPGEKSDMEFIDISQYLVKETNAPINTSDRILLVNKGWKIENKGEVKDKLKIMISELNYDGSDKKMLYYGESDRVIEPGDTYTFNDDLYNDRYFSGPYFEGDTLMLRIYIWGKTTREKPSSYAVSHIL